MQKNKPFLIEPPRPDELPEMLALLAANDLPTDGVEALLDWAVVARSATGLAGMAAVEPCDGDALLRSVAVAARYRGAGLGHQLTVAAQERARRAGFQNLYLLTTTAAGFFAERGFRIIVRSDVPLGVQASAEFSQLCPASATVMTRPLQDKPGRREG